MNRIAKGMALATALTVVVVAPVAGAPRSRTETAAYERASGIHVMDLVWFEVAAGELPQAQPLAREKTVSITIEDDSGRPVAGEVHQGDAVLADICGSTDAPLALVNRQPVHVHVYSGAGCSDVTAPTTGSVTFTFTR